MKPLWVQQFYNEWGFYPMAGGTLGDGSGWDETNPQQSTLANTLDSYDRDVRIGVRGRMANEHEWPSSQSVTSAAGMHKFITLQNQATKPTIAGTQLAAIYTKTVGAGLQELFYENEIGTEVQVTARGVVQAGGTGSIISSTYVAYSAATSGTGQFVFTDTTPQISNGFLCMSVNYAPTSTGSTIRIFAKGMFSSTAQTPKAMAIFQGTTADAIGVGCDQGDTAQAENYGVTAMAFVPAATTASTLYTVRVGGSASTLIQINGTNPAVSGRILGTCPKSFIMIEEIHG